MRETSGKYDLIPISSAPIAVARARAQERGRRYSENRRNTRGREQRRARDGGGVGAQTIDDVLSSTCARLAFRARRRASE